ncbi:hypothetical protein KP509_09G071600 [Ceratopteris richardii]|uniref:Uncharacterized protein n=1 Tax=Ceratopteris richardii TaxID=49495 RepID=A0A8T2U5X1_CERRI|nr:hypothetical protein KP509_09G071600 [Ceratopteris richardii]
MVSALSSSLLSRIHPVHHLAGCNIQVSESATTTSLLSFEASLVEKLGKLAQSNEDCATIHPLRLAWISKALDVIISTQASLKTLIMMHADSTAMALFTTKALQQYLDANVQLLDACCFLKEILADVERQINVAVHALSCLQGLRLDHVQRGYIQRARNALIYAQRLKNQKPYTSSPKVKKLKIAKLYRVQSYKFMPKRTNNQNQSLIIIIIQIFVSYRFLLSPLLSQGRSMKA